MEEKHYRHELKYDIAYTDYLAMRGRLQKIMQSDPHASSDGLYQIRSIYFDNSDDKALREKVDGIEKREKFRIRYYNDDFSFITLEKKMKINDLCLKIDAPITEEECRKILSGDLAFMRGHPDGPPRRLLPRQAQAKRQAAALVRKTWAPALRRASMKSVTSLSQRKSSMKTSSSSFSIVSRKAR